MSNTGSIAPTSATSAISAVQRLQRNDPSNADAAGANPVFTRDSKKPSVRNDPYAPSTSLIGLLQTGYLKRDGDAALYSAGTKLLAKMTEGKVNDVRFMHEGQKAVVHFDPKKDPAVTVKVGSPGKFLTVSRLGDAVYDGIPPPQLKNDNMQAAIRLAKAALAAAGGAANQSGRG